MPTYSFWQTLVVRRKGGTKAKPLGVGALAALLFVALGRKSPKRPNFGSIDRLIFPGLYGLAQKVLSAFSDRALLAWMVRLWPSLLDVVHGGGKRWLSLSETKS